jgi:hypothetical protein
MKHSDYIGKIGLVVGNEKYVGIGQGFYDFGTFNLQLIETPVTLVG